MIMRKLVTLFLFISLLLAMQSAAGAAVVPTVTQTFNLTKGWNAVYLEVQPLESAPAVVFKGLPSGSNVWAWSGLNESPQFISDKNTPTVSDKKWQVVSTDPAESDLNNLFAITANTAFLIEIPATSPSLTLNIAGRPTMRPKTWIPGDYNLAGFGFTSSLTTFSAFFTPSIAHKDQPIYRLNGVTGVWEAIGSPVTTPMKSGEAFWIMTKGASSYQGPLNITANGADGLDFGLVSTDMSLTITNSSAIRRTVKVFQRDSFNAVDLSYKVYNPANGLTDIKPLAVMPEIILEPGKSTDVNLVVRRENFNGAAASVLECTDNAGSRIWVPVTAEAKDIKGLWTGNATLTNVSMIADATVAKPTPAALTLNLILHQDVNRTARLLKQVIVMHQDASPTTKDRDVLITNDKLISSYQGVSMRDGVRVGHRISAVGFDFSPSPGDKSTDPSAKFDNSAINCSGEIAKTGTVTCILVLESSATSTHPTNPFLHTYHPDHDNLGSDFTSYSPEVNRIVRNVTLQFTDSLKDTPGWGITVLGGNYTEVVKGLAANDIKTTGTFFLNLASDVGLLNE